MNFDDNALFRHPDIVALRDLDEEDPAEIEASKFDLELHPARRQYRLPREWRGPRHGHDGHHQALWRAARQLPRRGRGRFGRESDRGVQDHAAQPELKAILINIFGGIMKCDVIAEGVVTAAREVSSRCRWSCGSKAPTSISARRYLPTPACPLFPAATWRTPREKVVAAAGQCSGSAEGKWLLLVVLTLIQRISMGILIDKNTRVLTQGITGKTGQFHTKMGKEYANGNACYVAGVTPKKGGQTLRGHTDLRDVKEAKQATGANVSVIYVPPPYAAAAIDEAVDADLDLVICITDGIPVRDMVRTRYRMQGKQDAADRANCPGCHHARRAQDRHHAGPHPQGPGRRGFALRHADLRGGRAVDGDRSRAVELRGHRRRPGERPEAHRRLRMFNDDPQTEGVVMVGEIGGSNEEEAARWVKDNMKKPVVGFIAGVTAPPGKRMGHAGASSPAAKVRRRRSSR